MKILDTVWRQISALRIHNFEPDYILMPVNKKEELYNLEFRTVFVRDLKHEKSDTLFGVRVVYCLDIDEVSVVTTGKPKAPGFI